MSTSRLIVADDHQVVRQGIRNILEQTSDLKVIAEAADGAEAERQALSVPADLLLLDLSLPVKRGMQVLESLRKAGSKLPVLLFSMHPAGQYVHAARRIGAQGFVSKDADASELLQAIRRVLGGGTSFPHASDGHAGTRNPFATLSARETQVMQGLLRGEPLTDIALSLAIDAKSISTYRRRLLDKLGVGSNAELAALAARHGQI